MATRTTRSQALSLVTQANQASGSSQGASTQNAHSRSQAGSSTQGPSSQATQQTEIDFATYGPFHKAILGVFIAQSILDAQQVRRMFQQTCAACKGKLSCGFSGLFRAFLPKSWRNLVIFRWFIVHLVVLYVGRFYSGSFRLIDWFVQQVFIHPTVLSTCF